MIDYFNINAAVWKFFKKYLEPVSKDTTDTLNWSQIYEESENVYNKYPCDYCKELVFIQLNELERIYRENNHLKDYRKDTPPVGLKNKAIP